MKDVIKFYADWCGPCKVYAPFFTEVSEELKDKYKLVEINIDKDVTGTVAKFKVMSVPTTVIVESDGSYRKKVGLMNPEQLNKFLVEDVKKA